MRFRELALNPPEPTKVAPYLYGVAVVISLVSFGLTLSSVFRSNNMGAVSTETTPDTKAHQNDKWPLVISNILQRNLFNREGSIPDASLVSTCLDKPQKSRLSYKVVGIIFGGTANSSIAVLQSPNAQGPSSYRYGDELPAGGFISDISRDRVYITLAMCPEYLEIEYKKIEDAKREARNKLNGSKGYTEKGFERSGNTTTVTKEWVTNILNNNLPTTLQDARAVPHIEGGSIHGFNLTEIVPNSVYSKLGFENGDVVTTINGVELNDAARAIQTLNSLRSENNVEIAVIRNGLPIVLKVNIE